MKSGEQGAPRPLVSLTGVNVRLGGTAILREITWSLHPGEHWVVVGANGSGKSTFLRLIRGDQWPEPGIGSRTYRFDGIETHHAVGVRERIGIVSPEQQERYVRLDFGLQGRTAIETGFFNTDYLYAKPSRRQDEQVSRLIETLGIEYLATKNIGRLSQGELRKILIARALVHEPCVLLLDEVTTGLDRASRGSVLEVLERVAQGGTQTVFVTHRATERLHATTHELRLRGGRIVSAGPVGAQLATADTQPRRSPPATAHEAAHPPFLIRIERADVYLDEQPVLHQIDWNVAPGQHWLLLGPNGSGKSTLAKLAAGLLHPAYGGTVRHFGAQRPTHLWSLKRKIAFLSDEMQTAYDQDIPARLVVASGFFSSVGLYAPLDAAQQRTVEGLIERFGLERLADRTFLRLSFGERRKILIARALVLEPQIVVVDEATNGLDAAFRAAFGSLLEDLAAAGTTLIVISHHEDDVPPVITHELWMEEGRIVRQAGIGER
jgi:molybdate transport system ATP-binding protein